MGFITKTVKQNGAVQAATVTVLSDSDDLEYTPNKGQVLIIRNPTQSILAPRITGSEAPSKFNVSGVGEMNLSSGYQSNPTIPIGSTAIIYLDAIKEWLKGTVKVTEGQGLEVVFIEQAP